MLHDPKWDKPQADVMSTTSLIAWLERQDAKQRYCYHHSGECLLSQYFQENYPGTVAVSGSHIYTTITERAPLPAGWNDIAKREPYTFGAAQARAKAMLAEAAS